MRLIAFMLRAMASLDLTELRKCARSKNITILNTIDIMECRGNTFRKNVGLLLPSRKRQERTVNLCFPCQKEVILISKQV